MHCVVALIKSIILFVILTVSINHSLFASHVVGGNLEMISINKTSGQYRVALNLYFDEINQNVGGSPENKALMYVYRKSDSKRIISFYIEGFSKQNVNYTNQACATLQGLKTTLYRYEGTVNWNPKDYDDPGGYYMTWQYCCRNGVIDNIYAPSLAGQTFYLEFPALTQNGLSFINSSPVFDQVDGEYLCINEPFAFSFDAKDADGDELRYSLATPFDRLDSNIGVGSNNGLTIRWKPGYDSDKAIPGIPPLSVNNQTGELTVTPNQLGLYVFTVVVEEYRSGRKIGVVRRDYQLLVVDCPPIIPPDPTVTYNGRPATAIQVCEGKSIELKAIVNTAWNYQWKKDGNNIAGATTPNLMTTESGIYQLYTSLKAQCSKSRRSVEIKVTITKSNFTIKSQDPLRLCGESGTVRLEAFSGVNLVYQWFYNGQLISTSNQFVAKQPGRYWAIVRDNVQSCASYSDTVRLTSTTLPIASITAQSSTTSICANDSLELATVYQSAYRYQWLLNGTVIDKGITSKLVANQVGRYTVTVTDTSACQQTSQSFTLSIAPTLVVKMDSIPTQCGFDGKIITLQGTPAGGSFGGLGVTGKQFDPSKAGIGHHIITYTIKNDLVCQAGVAQQLAIVAAPTVRLIPSRSVSEICAGDSLLLTAQTPLNSAPYKYNWVMNNQPIAGKDIIAAKQAGSYQATVIDKDGCKAQSESLTLTIATTIRVMMDSVPILCSPDHPPIALHGSPVGGIFSGPGVTGNQYDPSLAGVGQHLLTYTINSAFSCQNGTAQQVGIVQAFPIVDLGPDKEIDKGSSVQLYSGAVATNRFLWEPPTDLSNSTISAPLATPNQTISYTLTVTDQYGCSAADAITVSVYDRIWIPDAFSPNGDGVNEYWELRGIENYPAAEVIIFNRWGESVFFSKAYKKPFDGTFKDLPLPAGLYAYQIKPSSSRATLRGTLMILK